MESSTSTRTVVAPSIKCVATPGSLAAATRRSLHGSAWQRGHLEAHKHCTSKLALHRATRTVLHVTQFGENAVLHFPREIPQ